MAKQQNNEACTNKATDISKKMCLYWFSGSGNTLRLAEAFANQLRSRNWSVELRDIEHSQPENIDPDIVFGLAFPTHCFAIPEIVRHFIEQLPQVEKTPAIYIGTHGALSFGVQGHLKRILTRKGFQCQAGRIIRMPDSYFPFFSKRANNRRIAISLKKVESFANDFDEARSGWFRVPILSDLTEILFASFFACRRWTATTNTSVHPKQKLCIGCGRCVNFCPVHALTLNENNVVGIPNHDCINCLRCVAICPTDAMRHLIGFLPYHGEPSDNLTYRLKQNLTTE